MHRPNGLAAALVIEVTTALAGCVAAPPRGPETLSPATLAAADELAPAADASPPASTSAFLDPADPELTEAVRRFQETGKAPVIRSPGFVRFPFGETQPVLYCKPLRVCDVQLELGEIVIDVALGDSDRWMASKLESGPPGARVAHVLLKPTEFDAATNLVITTDRRVYHLGLVSTAGAQSGYFRSVRFYYPSETIQRWASSTGAATRERELAVASLPSVSPEALHFGYRIAGERVPWRPIQAFDDGTRVFLLMPDAMRANEAPALFVQSEEEENALVNYRVRGRYYVVDRLFAKAVLALGVGRNQQRVTITRIP